MSKQLSADKKQEIQNYAKKLIAGVMDWYCTGAIDCTETRKNINRDLDSVLPRVAEKFSLKPFKRVLRVRSDGTGWLTVRMEDRFLN